METKAVGSKFEFKSDSGDGKIIGYGAFYGNSDAYKDIIKSGAFSEINRSIKMLYQHRDLMGVWDSVKEDQNGLIVEGTINTKTTVGRDAYELAKSGALTDLSVGFKTQKYYYDDEGTRFIEKADLYEVSLVSFPANEKANVISVKSDDIHNERDFENALRQLGYSNKEAKHIANFGFKSLQTKKETGELVKFEDILMDLKNFKI